MTEDRPPLDIAPPEPDRASTALTEALVGIRLTDADRAVVSWLRAQRPEYLADVVALLERIRQAGFTEGYQESRRDMEIER